MTKGLFSLFKIGVHFLNTCIQMFRFWKKVKTTHIQFSVPHHLHQIHTLMITTSSINRKKVDRVTNRMNKIIGKRENVLHCHMLSYGIYYPRYMISNEHLYAMICYVYGAILHEIKNEGIRKSGWHHVI